MTKRNALITGGARGIGAATAKALLRKIIGDFIIFNYLLLIRKINPNGKKKGYH